MNDDNKVLTKKFKIILRINSFLKKIFKSPITEETLKELPVKVI
jgi:hypothetical protein